ncbi:MAG TPA: sodium:proton antiporter, partial [Bacillota bacterium]|nr:sodium:proton antiporter [Bacillota bacterium]
ILAMTDEAAYNALVCQTYISEYGYDHTFLLPVRSSEDKKGRKVPHGVKANILFQDDTFETLNEKVQKGYTIETIDPGVEEKTSIEDIHYPGTLLFIQRENDALTFMTRGNKPTVQKGDAIVVFANSLREHT